MTEIQIFILVIGCIVVLGALAVLIYKWARHRFYEYNEYTGRVELKSKIQRDNELLRQKYEKRQKELAKKPANAAKAANNINNSVQNTVSKPRKNETPQEKSARRARETYAKVSELHAKNPGHDFNIECIGASVAATARRAKVIECKNGKNIEVVRDFVVTFNSDYGRIYACVEEDLFNDLSIGKSGMLTLADGSYLNFEPYLDIVDIVGD